MKFFDSHAHLASSSESYNDLNSVINQAAEKGVAKIVDSAIDVETSSSVLNLHNKHPETIIPTLGSQPEMLIPGSDIYDKRLDSEAKINKMMGDLRSQYKKGEGKFKAIGECGLDYYWLNRKFLKAEEEIRSLQINLFEQQIDFAQTKELPLIIHSRGAERLCLKVLLKCLSGNSRVKVLFHSFTGNLETAKEIFSRGYFISFNGILTYSKAEEIRNIFKIGWNKHREQVLSETDSPYLIPSNRKKSESTFSVCVPGDIIWVVEKMASIVKSETDIVGEYLFENACSFYSL